MGCSTPSATWGCSAPETGTLSVVWDNPIGRDLWGLRSVQMIRRLRGRLAHTKTWLERRRESCSVMRACETTNTRSSDKLQEMV